MNSEFTSAFSIQHSELRLSPRRGYIDALRGLAVLIMIEAHVLDSWTRFPTANQTLRLRDGAWRVRRAALSVPRRSRGASLCIETEKNRRRPRRLARCCASRSRDLRPRVPLPDSGVGPRLVSAAVALESRHPQHHGAVDHGRCGDVGRLDTLAGRLAAFTAATLAIALTTPIVRNISILSPLPDPIEAYLRRPVVLPALLLPVGGLRVRRGAAGLVLDHSGRLAARARSRRRIWGLRSPASALPLLLMRCRFARRGIRSRTSGRPLRRSFSCASAS